MNWGVKCQCMKIQPNFYCFRANFWYYKMTPSFRSSSTCLSSKLRMFDSTSVVWCPKGGGENRALLSMVSNFTAGATYYFMKEFSFIFRCSHCNIRFCALVRTYTLKCVPVWFFQHFRAPSQSPFYYAALECHGIPQTTCWRDHTETLPFFFPHFLNDIHSYLQKSDPIRNSFFV